MTRGRGGAGAIAGLLMICLLAGFLFFVLAAAAGVYKDISAVMEEQYSSQTAMGYVTAKLHQSDGRGMLSLGDLAGTPALVITEELEGEDYTTYVYCHEGYIMELFCPATESLLPSDGVRVVAAERLELTQEGALIRIEAETSGGVSLRYAALRSEGGGA